MDTLKEEGLWYLSNRKVKHNDAVMFDIDDTLIFTNGRANEPIIDLLHASQKMGYKIIIITARPGMDRVIQWTMRQLKQYGIGYHYLGFTSAPTKHLMKKHLPYNFILSVGDMPTDLTNSKHYLNISNFDHN
jgi:ribonucleotide monophosphatase NagD (HAD superfamily)|tara:strand:+ start:4507 stop:4902 length:396 start_codon:yes stop_codon:yes gene_type:complete